MLRLQRRIFLLVGLAASSALSTVRFFALRQQTSNLAPCQHPDQWPAAVGCTCRSCLPRHRARRVAFLTLVTGLGMMAQWNVRVYLHQPASSGAARPHLRAPGHLLSLHAAGLAGRRRLADNARRHRRHCRGVCLRRRAAIRAIRRGGKRPVDAACVDCRGNGAAGAAAQTYAGHFDRLLDDHIMIFAGVTYTDARVVTGISWWAKRSCSVRSPVRSTPSPRRVCAGSSPRSYRPPRFYLIVGVIAWYVNGFRGEARRTRSRAAVHHEQHRGHAGRIRPRPHYAGTLSRRGRHRRRRRGEQPRRWRISVSGTGAPCRHTAADSGNSRTTTFPTSTSIATRSTARRGR